MTSNSSVTVKSLNGDTHVFELDGTATVLDVKSSINEKLGHPVKKQSLLHKEQVLKDDTVTLAAAFGNEPYEVTLLNKNELEFDENFETDASNTSELEANYPNIGSQKNITVRSGVLIKAGNTEGNIIYKPEADEATNRVVYKISITCGSDRYNTGLGCLVCSGETKDENCTRSSNRFCFHPGMGGGEFRIEGEGGHYNTNIGFTPPKWEDNVGGTKFTIELNKNGNHKVTLTHPRDDLSYESKWTAQGLWNGDLPPKFGIYDGDVTNGGSNTYYTNFSVRAA